MNDGELEPENQVIVESTPRTRDFFYEAITEFYRDRARYSSLERVPINNLSGQSFDSINTPDENCDGFAVSPVDTNVMMYGAVDMETSTDGGQSFVQTSTWYQPFAQSYIHADVRTLEAVGKNFYVGTSFL